MQKGKIMVDIKKLLFKLVQRCKVNVDIRWNIMPEYRFNRIEYWCHITVDIKILN